MKKFLAFLLFPMILAAQQGVQQVNVRNIPLLVKLSESLDLSGLTNLTINASTNAYDATTHLWLTGISNQLNSVTLSQIDPWAVVLGTNGSPWNVNVTNAFLYFQFAGDYTPSVNIADDTMVNLTNVWVRTQPDIPFDVNVTNAAVLTQTAPLIVTNVTSMGKQKVISFDPAFFQSDSVACGTNTALSPVITISGVTNFFLMGYRLFETSMATNVFEMLITKYPNAFWPTTNAAIITPSSHWVTNVPAIIASTNGTVHTIGTNTFQVYDRIGTLIPPLNGEFSVQFVNKGTMTNLNNGFWIELIGYEETE